MSQAVKRACDACHRRKVKCDGINPCRNCSSAQLSCTYNAIPQKKGPKGSRAKVISELRETQRQTSLSHRVQNRMNGIQCSPMTNPAPTPGLLTGELVKECVHFFFDNMYPQMPILDRHQVEQQILYMEQNRDAYCLMTSLCAFVMLQPGMSMPSGDPYNLDMIPGANIISSQLLLEETLRVRRGYEYLDAITFNVLATDYFIFGCYYAQELHDKAWFYLREATTMIQMIGMYQEEHYMQLDAAEAARRRRLYWLFFMTERAYALQRHRPLTLQNSIKPPTMSDDPSDPMSHQLSTFITLVNMFRPFDDALAAKWNKTRSHLSAQYVTGLQKQLNELVQNFLCQDPNFNDFRTNQRWLKNTAWQLNTGSVNGTSDDSVFNQYPAEMARQLVMTMASQFPGQGMELMNAGLIEKLVETADSMIEYLSMQPASRDPFATSPREHLSQMLNIIAMSRNGDHRFLPLLMSKMADMLPRLINPMLQNAPENTSVPNVDIFDGFGSAGMAQPAQMQLGMDPEYEQYETKYALQINTSSPESAAHSNDSHQTPQVAAQPDINNSFTASPALTSPVMEYPNSMNGYACTPISEMVVSPLSNPPNPFNAAPPTSQQPQQQQPQQQPPTPQHLQHQSHQHMVGSQLGHQHVGQPSYQNKPMTPTSMSGLGPFGAMRQPPQRQNNFHVQNGQQPPPPTMRTIGDFHGLQRGDGGARNSMMAVSSMTPEIDFGALR